LWFAEFRGNKLGMFDTKTEKFTTWSVPDKYKTLTTNTIMIAPMPSGKVWFLSEAAHLLDPKTGEIKSYPIPSGAYGMEALPNGNAITFSLGGGVITEIDAKTGQNTVYKPPTPDSGPRRGDVDAQGRAWFAEYNAEKIGMWDPQTKAIKEFSIPQPWGSPYDVVAASNGDVWAGGRITDYVFRLRPATGAVTKFLLPQVNANVRRIEIDRSAKTVWIGENHHGKIVSVEPLD
jgi:virginiamycin B lyase